MDILRFEQLPQGGFAGLLERQFVTDRRVFKQPENTDAFDGMGNFVYLADANFMPHGETGMHGHREIDVLTVMVEGRLCHSGSLEHGQSLEAGSVQVQRAGAEGFQHNEINPDANGNHVIQLWVMPDKTGESAGYKTYQPVIGELTQVYGGPQNQDKTFYSTTSIAIANATAGQTFSQQGPVIAYLSAGSGQMNGQTIGARTLVRSNVKLNFTASSNAQLIFICAT